MLNTKEGVRKLAVYIHLPFCVRKCKYCDFVSGSYTEEVQIDYVNQLLKEMDWFFEENRIPNDDAGVTEVVTRLGGYLQRLRFSELPPQCSINIFSVQEENMSAEALQSLRTLELYSYLVPHKDRRKKNADNKVSTYKLNSILAPHFELALEARANVELSKDDAEIIFNPQRKDEYEYFVRNKLKNYSFPFSIQRKGNVVAIGQRSLFDDEEYGL